ncbi:MAG: SBBP repeat-containing protein [Bryobacterales bacterium]|nr:SBBP repeat-containing protein [Bryobacterales bacterium]
MSRGEGYGVFLTPGAEAILALNCRSGVSLVRMRLPGAAAHPWGEGLAEMKAKSHYFLGGDSQRWSRNVPNYARVRYHRVYPGVDLVYYGTQGQLEFDFLVDAEADASRLRVQFVGAKRLRIDREGNVSIETGAGEARLLKPNVFQAGRRVEAVYALEGDGTLSFHLGAYDRTQALRIDPVLVYSSYLGGDAAVSGGSDYGRAVAVDAAGNIYLVGSTESAGFPVTAEAAQAKPGGLIDAFVIKMDPVGTCLYASFLGGEGRDEAFAVAVDSSGNAYVAGTTTSRKFPLSAEAMQTTLTGSANAFVTKFDAAGVVVYSTLLGGEGSDSAAAVAVNERGEAFVAGSTTSAKFPVTEGVLQKERRSAATAFVSKLDASGGTLLYSTYLGGTSSEAATALAVDSLGNAFVAGQTMSRDFPLTAGAYRTRISFRDAFVAKLDPTAGALVFSTLLGGLDQDAATGLSIDSEGNAVVTGWTSSRDLPVTKGEAMQTTYGGGTSDGFLAKLDKAGTALLYMSYLGGSERDVGTGVAWGAEGVVVVGETQSSDFPVSENAVQTTYGGGPADGFAVNFGGAEMTRGYATFVGGADEDRITGVAADPSGTPRFAGYTASGNFPCTEGSPQMALAPGGFDAFVTGLDGAGARVISTYVGGGGHSTNERALDIVVDKEGAAYVTGQTVSTNFPVSGGGFQPVRGGGAWGDAYVVKIAPDGQSLVYATYLGGSGDDAGVSIALDSERNAYITGTTASPNFPVSAGHIQRAIKGGVDVFAAKVSADGSSLVYATLLGSSSADVAGGIAVDVAGNAYVAGSTYWLDFPVTAGAFQTAFAGTMDAFVSKLSVDGTALVYSTLLGGDRTTAAASIAVDAAGNAYVTGTTSSANFPATSGALQTGLAGPSDAYVVKFDASGSSFRYATLLGGSGGESGRRIVVDSLGNAFVGGGTTSTDFPVTKGSFQTAAGGGGDAFVVKVKPDGASLAYGTYLGGVQGEEVAGLAVDSSGNAYMTGSTSSFVFPNTAGRFQTGLQGIPDAFLSVLDAEGKALQFSSQFGFTGGKTLGNAVAVDTAGKVYFAGQTSSPAFRTTAGAFQPAAGNPVSGFVTKFDLSATAPTPEITEVVNYVTGRAPVCGGSVIKIVGKNLAGNTAQAAGPLGKVAGPLPTRLGATVVRFGNEGRPVPLFSVSPETIVAQLPYSALDAAGDLTVTLDTETSKPFRPDQYGAAFGIVAVYKQDLSVVSQSNYLKPGETIIVYVTGYGKTTPGVASGAPAPETPVVVRYDEFNPYVSVNQAGSSTMKCDVTGMTLVPGMIGIAQAMVRIGPVSSDSDKWDLNFASSGVTSNIVPLWIQSPAAP